MTQKQAKQRHWKPGRYILLTLVLSVGLFIGHQKGAFAAISVPKFQDKQIEHVIFEGEFQFLNRDNLEEKLNSLVGYDYEQVNLKHVKEGLLKLDWVESVTVQRLWPSTLKIQIDEQKPIARWGDEGFVNHYGELVITRRTAGLESLPVLYGDQSKALELAKTYLNLSQLFSEQQLRVSGVFLSGDGSWSVKVNDQFTLELGKHDFLGRVDRFLKLYRMQLAAVSTEFDSVDLRYANGAAVKWRADSEALALLEKSNIRTNR